VNGTLLVECDPTVKVASSTEEVHASLPIVTFVRVIDFSLGEHQDLGSECVPLDLGTVSLVE
jgi:hypothetical protein